MLRDCHTLAARLLHDCCTRAARVQEAYSEIDSRHRGLSTEQHLLAASLEKLSAELNSQGMHVRGAARTAERARAEMETRLSQALETKV